MLDLNAMVQAIAALPNVVASVAAAPEKNSIQEAFLEIQAAMQANAAVDMTELARVSNHSTRLFSISVPITVTGACEPAGGP